MSSSVSHNMPSRVSCHNGSSLLNQNESLFSPQEDLSFRVNEFAFSIDLSNIAPPQIVRTGGGNLLNSSSQGNPDLTKESAPQPTTSTKSRKRHNSCL